MSPNHSMLRGLCIVLWSAISCAMVFYAPVHYIHGSSAPKDLVSSSRIGSSKQQGASGTVGRHRDPIYEALRTPAEEANPLRLGFGFALGVLTAIMASTQMGQSVEAAQMTQAPASLKVGRMTTGRDVDLGLAKVRADTGSSLALSATEKRAALPPFEMPKMPELPTSVESRETLPYSTRTNRAMETITGKTASAAMAWMKGATSVQAAEQ